MVRNLAWREAVAQSMWTGDSPTRSLTRRLESLRPSPRPPFDSDTQLKVVEVLYGYPVILTIHMTRSHTRLGQIIVCIPNHSPSISPFTRNGRVFSTWSLKGCLSSS